jgi:hypothetical protein
MKIIILFIITAFLMACGAIKIKEPIILPGEPYKCYKERYCMYQNQNNPDKSRCVKWSEWCSKILDYEYCRDPKNRISVKIRTRAGRLIEGDDFKSGCWDILR